MVFMLKVTAIVCFSSTYAGIFEGTGLFNGIIAPSALPFSGSTTHLKENGQGSNQLGGFLIDAAALYLRPI